MLSNLTEASPSKYNFFFTFSLSKLYVSTKEIIKKMRLSHYTHTSASNCQLLWALNSPTNITMEKNYMLHKRLTSKHTDNNVTKLLRISKLKNVILRTSGPSSNYKYKYLDISLLRSLCSKHKLLYFALAPKLRPGKIREQLLCRLIITSKFMKTRTGSFLGRNL